MLLSAATAQAGSLDLSLESSAAFTVHARGSADLPSTLRVFVQDGSPIACAGGGTVAENAQAQAARVNSAEVIAQAPSGPFAYSAPYPAGGPGTYVVCGYLFDAAPGTADLESTLIVVAERPAPSIQPQPPIVVSPDESGLPGATAGGAAPARCLVPRLVGRTYPGARKLLRRAGCSAGTVYRPSFVMRRRGLARGHVLRVVSQLPAAGSVRGGRARVTLRLAYVAPRRSGR